MAIPPSNETDPPPQRKDWTWDEEYQKPKWLADQYRVAGVRPPWGDKLLKQRLADGADDLDSPKSGS